ncbi:MAG: hypothetical protein IIC62_04485, partial [Proteobacteria bacterium]|nr:hypothetical protein [Pseudomonadota bacterium]
VAACGEMLDRNTAQRSEPFGRALPARSHRPAAAGHSVEYYHRVAIKYAEVGGHITMKGGRG